MSYSRSRTTSSSGPGGGAGNTKNIFLKLILLGDGGVGKSCLMNRFISNRFDTHSFHTIGVEFLNKEIEIDGQVYTIQIWDTAGQERFKSLRTPFYRGSDLCVLTFSIDDENSFTNLSTWKEEFLYYADVADKDNFPFIVVGNKLDLEHEKRKVSSRRAEDWCAQNGNVPYIETSAKMSTNVDSAFRTAVERWAKLDSKLDRPYRDQTVDLTAQNGIRQNAQASNSCC